MPPRKRPIESYTHTDAERTNIPPAGLVTAETDPDDGETRTYQYDPHLDPQLVWAGKAEHTSFDVPTVSLHVHERIDPRTVIEAVRKRNGNGHSAQPSLFETAAPLREAIDFYQHAHGWSNRLIAGDSLLVMNSLLEKEGMAGKVQMVYLDPPYGIKYGSNFQPFVNKRTVKDGADVDLTAEPEQLTAFRDTWELGIHSYLTYLRDRLMLAKELLADSGSVFVQIGDENVHLVRNLLDDVFGPSQFVSQISFRTKIPLNAAYIPNIADHLIWYAKNKSMVKHRKLFTSRDSTESEQFTMVDLMASGYTASCHFEFYLDDRRAYPNPNTSWKTTPEGIKRLIAANRLRWRKNVPGYIFYHDDYPVMELTSQWSDTMGATGKVYAVQTSAKVIQRCMLMATDPGDLVLDPTCGSGTTAYVAEQWGRRWITCDTSRVALALTRQRLISATYTYYELAQPDEGVGSGFKYTTVPHVTLGSIANNPDIHEGMTQEQIDAAIARYAPKETLYDQPLPDSSRMRVSGPFTVEAVPAPTVATIEDFATPDIDSAEFSHGAPPPVANFVEAE